MQVTDVKKPLMSAARICDAGHEVFFQSAGGDFKHTASGQITKFNQVDNVYRWKVSVAQLGVSGQRPPVIFPCEEDDPARPHFVVSGGGFWDVGLE